MINFSISGKTIGYNYPVFFIAEAGVNHNGKLDLALKLVDVAADAGADAIKFQTFRAEQVVTSAGKMADYQKKNIGKTESQIEMLRKLEFNESWYPKVISHCKKRGIIFMSTPHGHIESADFLNGLGVPVFKIGSGDLTNKPFLEHVSRFGKPMILGTGMATLSEVKDAATWIKGTGNKKIIFLHCTTNYPCPAKEVNLKAMQTMIKELPDIFVGYSDHTEGWLVSSVAVALGACVIEKHLTLDKNMKGPDHKASSNPEELKNTIKAIRSVPIVMGSSLKKPVENEMKVSLIVRKSLVAIKDIKKGDIFGPENIGIKRPGTGLTPRHYFSILSKTCLRNIRANTLIKKEHYES